MVYLEFRSKTSSISLSATRKYSNIILIPPDIKVCRIRTNGSATATEAAAANQELLAYLANLVELRSKQPEDDLISKLVEEQVRAFVLSNMSLLAKFLKFHYNY